MSIKRPQLSIRLPSYMPDASDWNDMRVAARAADHGGIDRLTVSDHVVFGENLEEYARPEIGGQAGGKQPTGPDGHWLDPITTLTYVAGMTSRIRLGTAILIAALRRPVVLAKELATLDVLSGGRTDIGVGVGWQKEEYEAAGLKFEGRGHLLDHTLEVCQTLWRNQRANYTSPLLTFNNIHQMPKPLQAGGVPIWVSGTINKMTVSRLARFGSGWIPWGAEASNMTEALPRMKAELAKLGRDVSDLQATCALPVVNDAKGEMDIPRTMEKLRPLVEAGVTDFRMNLPLPGHQGAATEKVRKVVAGFRTAVGRPLND